MGYRRTRWIELADYAAPDAIHFAPIDARALIVAAEIILRAARALSLTRIEQQIRFKESYR